MEKLLEILKNIKPNVNFETNEDLINEEILDSFDIISLVSAINDEFDIEITAADIIPENFNSAKAMYQLIKRLEDEV